MYSRTEKKKYHIPTQKRHYPHFSVGTPTMCGVVIFRTYKTVIQCLMILPPPPPFLNKYPLL